MKATSLRLSMQTLLPDLTPSRCKPPAIRSVRPATSAWSRFRWPLMMPRNDDSRSSIFSFSLLENTQCFRHRRAKARSWVFALDVPVIPVLLRLSQSEDVDGGGQPRPRDEIGDSVVERA